MDSLSNSSDEVGFRADTGRLTLQGAARCHQFVLDPRQPIAFRERQQTSDPPSYASRGQQRVMNATLPS